MPNVYILLTRSATLLSRIIALATCDAHTHVSICLDDNLDNFYSFARRTSHLPLPAGLVRENLRRGYWGCHPGIPCTLLRLPVSETAYARIERRLARMNAHADDYHYSLLGVLFCRFDIIHRRPDHYFCSQFVGELLSAAEAVTLPRDTALLHPDDFLALPTAEVVFSGSIGALANTLAPSAPFRLSTGSEVHS